MEAVLEFVNQQGGGDGLQAEPTNLPSPDSPAFDVLHFLAHYIVTPRQASIVRGNLMLQHATAQRIAASHDPNATYQLVLKRQKARQKLAQLQDEVSSLQTDLSSLFRTISLACDEATQLTAQLQSQQTQQQMFEIVHSEQRHGASRLEETAVTLDMVAKHREQLSASYQTSSQPSNTCQKLLESCMVTTRNRLCEEMKIPKPVTSAVGDSPIPIQQRLSFIYEQFSSEEILDSLMDQVQREIKNLEQDVHRLNLRADAEELGVEWGEEGPIDAPAPPASAVDTLGALVQEQEQQYIQSTINLSKAQSDLRDTVASLQAVHNEVEMLLERWEPPLRDVLHDLVFASSQAEQFESMESELQSELKRIDSHISKRKEILDSLEQNHRALLSFQRHVEEREHAMQSLITQTAKQSKRVQASFSLAETLGFQPIHVAQSVLQSTLSQLRSAYASELETAVSTSFNSPLISVSGPLPDASGDSASHPVGSASPQSACTLLINQGNATGIWPSELRSQLLSGLRSPSQNTDTLLDECRRQLLEQRLVSGLASAQTTQLEAFKRETCSKIGSPFHIAETQTSVKRLHSQQEEQLIPQLTSAVQQAEQYMAASSSCDQLVADMQNQPALTCTPWLQRNNLTAPQWVDKIKATRV
eukprot:m.214167 g.214167  ORF g.214167 m.214167 type:complete len:646 (-) comp15098_c0_seq1:2967-4904(-)